MDGMPAQRTTSRPWPAGEATVRRLVAEALDRWPSAGVAVAVVRDGAPPWFHCHGVADVRSGALVTRHTVFRTGSLTKTFTAIAVLRLWEAGLVDLDAPASDYLRAFRLVTPPGLRPATIRHLLTHTGGIGYWRRLSDLLHPWEGAGVQVRGPTPTLAAYYRGGLPQEIEPGTKWVYSNHGFAVLGQIVEDVSGLTLGDFLRGRVLDPLGMDETGLEPFDGDPAARATGYVLRRHGLVAVADKAVPTVGGGAMYSTASDLARYVDVLLRPAAAPRPILRHSTVELMLSAQFRPDPRLPGAGLGFERGRVGGRETVGKDGVVNGFLSHLTMSPPDGLGVVVLTNTGGLDRQGLAVPLATEVLGALLEVPAATAQTFAPQAEVWHQLCGRYFPAPGPVTNLAVRLVMGAGVRVVVQDRQLWLRPMTPLPAARRGMRLRPTDPHDPYAFEADLTGLGLGPLPVVFERSSGGGLRLWFDLMSFDGRGEQRRH